MSELNATHRHKEFHSKMFFDVHEADTTGVVVCKRIVDNGGWLWDYLWDSSLEPIPAPRRVPFDTESWRRVMQTYPGQVFFRRFASDAVLSPQGVLNNRDRDWADCENHCEYTTDCGATWQPMSREVAS